MCCIKQKEILSKHATPSGLNWLIINSAQKRREFITVPAIGSLVISMLWFNFILGVNFFLLFLGTVIYHNQFETKENEI